MIDDLNSPPYKIYFALDYSFVREVAGKTIVIYPSGNKWNDFGHQSNFNFVISRNKKMEFISDIQIGFFDERKPYQIIEERLATKKIKGVLAEKLPVFFSMLIDMKAYRELVEAFGEEVELILNSLNDVVSAQRMLRLPNWYKDATNSEVFKYSFTRRSESFFAYKNAHSILDGLQYEEFAETSDSMDLTFKIAAYDNQHNINIQFDRNSFLPKNIAIFIGKNGTGKSQALSHLVKYALFGDIDFLNSGGERILFNRILAISTPGETQNTFPPERKGGRIYYKRLSLGRQLNGRKLTGLADVLLQLARSPEHINKFKRWGIFIKSIQSIFELEKIGFELLKSSGVDHRNKFVTFEELQRASEKEKLEIYSQINVNADPVRIAGNKMYNLSSGEISFLRFSAQICLHIENGSLVLLDEPETHLHPNLVMDLVDLLNKLLTSTGSVAIIATHSAYLVREMPRSQVHIFKEKEPRLIEVGTPRLKTMGAELGAISNFIFEDESFGQQVGKITAKLKSHISQPNYLEKSLELLSEELPSEALMKILEDIKIRTDRA